MCKDVILAVLAVKVLKLCYLAEESLDTEQSLDTQSLGSRYQGPGSHDGRCCSPCSTGAGSSERNRVCPLDAARIMSKGRQSFQCSQWTNYQSNDQKECCWIFYCTGHSKSLTLWDHELTTSRKPQRKAWIPFVEDKHNGDTYNCAASNRLRAKPCRQSC